MFAINFEIQQKLFARSYKMIKTFMTIRILCSLILFNLSDQNVSSYTILDLDDLSKPKLEKNIVDDYEFDDNNIKRYKLQDFKEVINRNGLMDEINKADYENYKHRNKILVKKIVPHDVAPTGIEFDHKFNTAYKPLVRVHKTKTINQFLNEIKLDKYNGIDTFSSPMIDKHNNFKLNDKVLLDPVETSKNDFMYTDNIPDFVKQIKTNIGYIKSAETRNNLSIKDKTLQLVKQIQKKIKGIKSESKKLKAYAKVINALNNILRSPKPEKSGEDDLPPGRGTKQEGNVRDTKPKKWIPHYPPWNYWTYKKTIHEDECPGTQAKIGNMCIWTPPH